MKIKFTRDYAPRKKGEVADVEPKVAQFYIDNGIAFENGVKPKKTGCSDCEEKAKAKDTQIEELTAANAEKDTQIEELTAEIAKLKK